jgi:hypothetical protein
MAHFFPKSQTNDVILASGAKDGAKTKIETGNGGCRIAPWHFDPQHGYYDKSQGTWNLKQYPITTRFRDSDGKYWYGNPPPNHAPKKFKDEELDGETILLKERWHQQKPLPPWVAVLARSEGNVVEPNLPSRMPHCYHRASPTIALAGHKLEDDFKVSPVLGEVGKRDKRREGDTREKGPSRYC